MKKREVDNSLLSNKFSDFGLHRDHLPYFNSIKFEDKILQENNYI